MSTTDNDILINGSASPKDVWSSRRDTLSQKSSTESQSEMSTEDWPALAETIDKVTKMNLSDGKDTTLCPNGDAENRDKGRKESVSPVSVDSSSDEPPTLVKAAKSNESWADSSADAFDEDEVEKDDKADCSAGGATADVSTCSAISVDPSAKVEPGPRRKSSKSSKLKWIPLPLPDLPPLKQRTGRRPSTKRSDKSRGKQDQDLNGNGNQPYPPTSPSLDGRRKLSPKAAARAAYGKKMVSRRMTCSTVRSSSSSINGDFPDFGPVGGPLPLLGSADFFMPYLGPNADYCPPNIDNNTLKTLLRNQIEYYFGAENLSRDFFLRRKMDSEGYLPIHLIASFHRVQKLTTDLDKVIQAIQSSTILEMKDGCLRTIFDPLRWPIIDNIPMSPLGLTAHSRSFSLPMGCGGFRDLVI